MSVDQLVAKDYAGFIESIIPIRCEALRVGDWYTDKSFMEAPFLSPYSSLIGKSTPSVTEYGSGVPVLSLYFLSKKKISKLIAIDNDSSVLEQVEAVSKGLHLPVEIVNADIARMSSFPDTDLAVSINALYGFSPTKEQMNNPPKLTRSVILESSHKGFGVFKYLRENFPWEEKAVVLEEMRQKYEDVFDDSFAHYDLPNARFDMTPGGISVVKGIVFLGLHYVTGSNPKTL